jgi:hypothetical protein
MQWYKGDIMSFKEKQSNFVSALLNNARVPDWKNFGRG